jgi:hypothetical protein
MACSSNAVLQFRRFSSSICKCLGLSIGRADADEDSVFGSLPFQAVRARVAGVDPHSVQIPPRHQTLYIHHARSVRAAGAASSVLDTPRAGVILFPQAFAWGAPVHTGLPSK